jgi:glutathione reductase (NADPH)
MKKKGVEIKLNTQIQKIERINDRTRAVLTDGSTVEAQVMFATGRVANTANLGLEKIGVQLNPKGAIVVDDYSRTTVANIYAVGDCTDRLMLTPMALAEGQAVAETLFNNNPTMPNYVNVPTAVFSLPNVGTVGLTEKEARTRFGEIDVYKTTFKPLKHTLTGSAEQTMMKLVVERATGRVLGCHMVGADAAEIIQGLAIALNCGATKAQFDATIGIHPTAAEEFVTMREKVEIVS